jgi:5,10-methylenetetrahydromethanopterin reductase
VTPDDYQRGPLCIPFLLGSRQFYFFATAGTDPSSITEEQSAWICDAFGLFGEPEYCAERLIRAREEAGVERVFLFPAHDLKTGYQLPEVEVEAFGRVIGPRLAD